MRTCHVKAHVQGRGFFWGGDSEPSKSCRPGPTFCCIVEFGRTCCTSWAWIFRLVGLGPRARMQCGLARPVLPTSSVVQKDGCQKGSLAWRLLVTKELAGHQSISPPCRRMPKPDGQPCATLFGHALDGAARFLDSVACASQCLLHLVAIRVPQIDWHVAVSRRWSALCGAASFKFLILVVQVDQAHDV